MKKIISIVAICLILTLIAAVLVACVPNNMDKAKTKLEKADYDVRTADDLKIYKALFDGLEDGLEAYNSKTKGEVGAFLFKDKKSAQDAESNAKKLVDYYYDDDFSVVVKGKWIIIGNDEGIKAFTK
jgi:hypothetical protein